LWFRSFPDSTTIPFRSTTRQTPFFSLPLVNPTLQSRFFFRSEDSPILLLPPSPVDRRLFGQSSTPPARFCPPLFFFLRVFLLLQGYVLLFSPRGWQTFVLYGSFLRPLCRELVFPSFLFSWQVFPPTRLISPLDRRLPQGPLLRLHFFTSSPQPCSPAPLFACHALVSAPEHLVDLILYNLSVNHPQPTPLPFKHFFLEWRWSGLRNNENSSTPFKAELLTRSSFYPLLKLVSHFLETMT